MKDTMLLLFLIAGLSDAWCNSKVQQSVFWVGNRSRHGTGFVIERNILVTNFHVLWEQIKDQMHINHTYIRNKDGQTYLIEHIIGANLVADLALLGIKNYDGSELVLADQGSDHKDSFLVGFPKGEYTSINMSKLASTDEVHDYFSHSSTRDFAGASGSPIVNDQGKVITVLNQNTHYFAVGTKIGKLQRLLDTTRNQTIKNDDISRWITRKINDLNLLAIQGNSDAQYAIALMFYEGFGVEQSYEAAATWMRKAVEQGHAHAQYQLARMFYNGFGVEQSYQEAVIWKRKAAEQGHAHAQYKLALMFYNGVGVEQSYEDALTWMRKAAEQGYVDAQKQIRIIANAKRFSIIKNIAKCIKPWSFIFK